MLRAVDDLSRRLPSGRRRCGLRPQRRHGVLHARVGRRAPGGVEFRARRLELGRPAAPGEGQDVRARDVALRLDGVRAEDRPYQPLGLGADLAGAALEPFARPQRLRLEVLRRHVRGIGRVLALAAAQAPVLRDGLAAVQDRDGGRAQPHVDGPADEAVRHRVAHVVALHVVVRRHLAAPPLVQLERRPGQRVQRRALLAEERVVATALGALAGVEGVDEPPHLAVQLVEGREALVGERCEHPHLAQVHRLLHRALVPRFPLPGRHHRAPVVLGHLEVGVVDLHRVGPPPAVGGGGAVVRHEDVGDPSRRLERVHVRLDPGPAAHVGEALGPYPARPGEDRDEQVGGRPPARHRVEDRCGEARPVHVHRPAGLVRDARREAAGPRVLADLLAELGVLVEPLAARVTIEVARPLQRERHLRHPRELVADALVIGLEVLFAALRPAVGEEARDLRVGHRLQPLRVDPPLVHLGGALRHRRLAAPERPRRLVPAHPLQQLAHYLLLRGHAGLLSTGRGHPGGAPS